MGLALNPQRVPEPLPMGGSLLSLRGRSGRRKALWVADLREIRTETEPGRKVELGRAHIWVSRVGTGHWVLRADQESRSRRLARPWVPGPV